MFNSTEYIINNAENFCTFYDRFSGEYLANGYVIGDMCFLADEEGIIEDACFSIEWSGIRSYRSRVNASHVMGIDADEIYVAL